MFCVKYDMEFLLLADELKKLDKLGTNSRYLNDEFYIDEYLLEQAIKDAEIVFTVVQNKISKNL